MPELIEVAAGQTVNEIQIQRNAHKIGFHLLEMAKGAGDNAWDAVNQSMQNTFVTLKRISSTLGEKSIWPRMSLRQLKDISIAIEGYAFAKGNDAGVVAQGYVSVEVSLQGNLALVGGDYLSLTVENSANCALKVYALPTSVVSHNHMKITKTTLQAGDYKRIDVGRADFVYIPSNIQEVRLIGEDTATVTANDLKFFAMEYSAPLLGSSGGVLNEAAVLPAKAIDFLDVVANGPCDVFVIRQKDYEGSLTQG